MPDEKTPTDVRYSAVERAVKAERDYVDGQIGILQERLDAIDKATKLLNETVNRVPTALQEGLGNLERIMDERFKSVALQFTERDTRSEREARDNKVAVDAAFAAQKEAAAKEAEFNRRAIEKSEAATTDTINKLGDLFKTTTDGLVDKINDLKGRVVGMEQRRIGSQEATGEQQVQRTASTAANGLYIAIAGVAVSIGAIVAAVIASG